MKIKYSSTLVMGLVMLSQSVFAHDHAMLSKDAEAKMCSECTMMKDKSMPCSHMDKSHEDHAQKMKDCKMHCMDHGTDKAKSEHGDH